MTHYDVYTPCNAVYYTPYIGYCVSNNNVIAQNGQKVIEPQTLKCQIWSAILFRCQTIFDIDFYMYTCIICIRI